MKSWMRRVLIGVVFSAVAATCVGCTTTKSEYDERRESYESIGFSADHAALEAQNDYKKSHGHYFEDKDDYASSILKQRDERIRKQNQ